MTQRPAASITSVPGPAVRASHGCGATFVESVSVREEFESETVWDGEVQVFELAEHPTASRCYAWSHATEGEKRRFCAVLHAGPVDGPAEAVRAAIVARSKGHN